MNFEITIKNGITFIDTKDTFDRTPPSGFPGVVFIEKNSRYRAQIYRDRRNFYLGTFDTPEEAYSARKDAEERYSNGTFYEWYEEASKLYKHKPYKHKK